MMTTAFSLLSLLLSTCSAFQTSVEQHHDLQTRQLQANGVPYTQNFISRAYHTSIIVGNYLYIDGGEISFNDNGVKRHLTDNNTYSIDLNTSWNNQTVTFNQINKTAPVMNYVSLWADPSNTSFYAYGGEQSGITPFDVSTIPTNSLWQFTIEGDSGSWAQVSLSSNSIFPSLVRPAAGIGSYGNGTGYLLGGYATPRTSSETSSWKGFTPVPGLLSYDMSSNEWTNHSAMGYSTYGTAMYGAMQYVPQFGNQGLLVTVGGETSNQVQWKDQGSNLLSFATVNIYDIATNTWHNQTATGNIPPSRDRLCSVGVQGDNGTFEIFVYGGHVAASDGTEPQASATQAQKDDNLQFDSVYVLTLPGFHWQKANYTPTHPREDFTCNLAGNRQMVVVGGINPMSQNLATLVTDPDIWTQGIGVFDLSEMAWKDGYDANAEPYVSPQVVQDWYQQNGTYPAKWQDSTVEALFVQSASSTNSSSGSSNSTNTSGGSASSGSTGPSGSTSPAPASGSTSHTGAIAGGVVGGVAGIAVIAGALWFFMRRKKPATTSMPEPEYGQSYSQVAEKPASPVMGAKPRVELESQDNVLYRPSELSSSQEMLPGAGGGRGPRYEME